MSLASEVLRAHGQENVAQFLHQDLFVGVITSKLIKLIVSKHVTQLTLNTDMKPATKAMLNLITFLKENQFCVDIDLQK